MTEMHSSNSHHTKSHFMNKLLTPALIGTLLVSLASGSFLYDKLIDEKAKPKDVGGLESYFGKNEPFKILLSPNDIAKISKKITDPKNDQYLENIKTHYLIEDSSGKFWGFNPGVNILYGEKTVFIDSGEKPLEKLLKVKHEMSRSGDFVIPSLRPAVENTPNEVKTVKSSTVSPEETEKQLVKNDTKLSDLRSKLAKRLKEEKEKNETLDEKDIDVVTNKNTLPSDQMNIGALRETDNALFYKKQEIPKIGFDSSGNKISRDEKRKQVKTLVEKVAELGEEWSIVYKATSEEKMKVVLFSDPSCPFCRGLYKQIPELQNAGITVYHLFYNRIMSPGSVQNPSVIASNNAMKNAWCSDNPQRMVGNLYKGYAIPEATCGSERISFPGNEHYFMGRMIDMKGTPYMATDKGKIVAGYDLNAPQPLTIIKRLGL